MLDGGAGRDKLSGGEGADTFRFSLREDSHRSTLGNFSDQILDFDPNQDKLDVSALGFTGLGNGYAGTLAVTTSVDGSHTYLKSYETDAEGRSFGVSLQGNHAAALSADNILFATPVPVDPNVEERRWSAATSATNCTAPWAASRSSAAAVPTGYTAMPATTCSTAAPGATS
ncbi:M10 family metallopeptidase C-terminal domain-containing protein [Azorhizophilus paspali]|uniref:M10 family metallopeptidase C-terminal domain-containing protein n=1 Tax=Azorhizophilus paspali TaxID=69963 RepID=UPI00364067F3